MPSTMARRPPARRVRRLVSLERFIASLDTR
jgi:hypothetical protein